MICFDQGSSRFNFRIGAICIHNDRLLVEKDSRYDFFVVPGGRAEFHESTDQSMLRELYEEVGEKAAIDRLLWVTESFFHLDDKDFHEIGFYYKVSFPSESQIYQKVGPFKGPENNPYLSYQWLLIDDAKHCKLFPPFLLTRIDSLPEQIEHIVVDER